MPEKIKLLKFGAQWCGPCQRMAKSQALEKFAEKHPEVEVTKYDLPDQEVECPKCGSYGAPGEKCESEDDDGNACGTALPKVSSEAMKAEELADEWEVSTIPTVIIVRGKEELGRSEEAISLRELENLYKEAVR